MINSTEKGEWLWATSEGSILNGLAGDDNLNGGDGDDFLRGGDDDDYLKGGGGNDALHGGRGNDTLKGGLGDDVYLFGRGEGHDLVTEEGLDANRRNVVRFREGVLASEIDIYLNSNRNGGSSQLIFRIRDTGDTITIEDALNMLRTNKSRGGGIQAVEFADGTVWEWEDILKRPIHALEDATSAYGIAEGGMILANNSGMKITGGIGNDTLIGGTGDDVLWGEDGDDYLAGGIGDDKLYGGNGNDTLWGGAGNDHLQGGAGDDTYVFGRGDGHDIIAENQSERRADRRNIVRLLVRPEDIELLTRNEPGQTGWTVLNDMIIRIKDTGETLTVKFGFMWNITNADDTGGIQAIEFVDGTVWEWEDICRQPVKVDDSAYFGDLHKEGHILVANDYGNQLNGNTLDNTLIGGAGGDALNANGGNNILWGRGGNDWLCGGTGNDVYLFGRGDGNDVIYEAGVDPNRRNIIRFRDGVSPDDILILTTRLDGHRSSLTFVIRDTWETLTVHGGSSNVYSNDKLSSSIQAVEFADGTVWEWDDFKDLRIVVNESQANADVDGSFLVGSDLHNNTLYGSNKTDHLYGMAGNDVLYGNGGNDVLWGGAGNDVLHRGAGDDLYIFGRGDGHDSINEEETRADRLNVILMVGGILPEDIEILINSTGSSSSELVFRIKDTGETITVVGGTSMVTPNSGNSRGYGYTAYEGGTLLGNETTDELFGSNNVDFLYGCGGDDKLYGYAGNDTLRGGAGNAYLEGGDGDDTYLFGLGDGNDTIVDRSGNDRIVFGPGIDITDLQFIKSGSHLIVHVVGQNDSINIRNHWWSTNNAIETFTAKGMELASHQLEQMIQAMASFGAPAGADGGWTDEQREPLTPIISGFWRASAQ